MKKQKYNTKNNKKFYVENILPLMKEINRMCNENRIPYFAAFGYHMDEKGKYVPGEGMDCMSLVPEAMGMQCESTYFAEFVNIINGAHTIYLTEGQQAVYDALSESDDKIEFEQDDNDDYIQKKLNDIMKRRLERNAQAELVGAPPEETDEYIPLLRTEEPVKTKSEPKAAPEKEEIKPIWEKHEKPKAAKPGKAKVKRVV